MTRTYLIFGVIAVIAALVGAHWYMTRPEFDAELTAAFEAVSDIHAYTQEDVTETIVSERLLRIEGTYSNDTRTDRYSSVATTTIEIPGEGVHSFSLSNISRGEDVYTKVVTDSPLLRQQIAFDAAWHNFRRDAIPNEFKDIAISGPIMDHLALFRDGGTRLDVIDGPTIDESASSTLRSYTFRLALGARSDAGGTLATLMERIDDGHVRIWIDEESMIRRIVIDDESFHSTTTLTGFNERIAIEPPEVTE